MAYLSTSIVKSDWLRIESADTTMDSLIGRMISAAEEELEGILNQPVESTTVVLYWEGLGEIEHRLFYTVPLSGVSLRYREDPTIAWKTANSADFAVKKTAYGYVVWYKNGFLENMEYEFTGTVGWSSATVPADILVAGYEIVKELYYETPYAGQSERFGLSGVTEGQGGTSFSKAILRVRPTIQEKLSHYRMLSI